MTPQSPFSPSPRTPHIGVLFLRRKRPGFDPQWGAAMETAARRACTFLDPDPVIPEVRIVDEQSLMEALEVCDRAGANVLLALQTTMSDGRLVPILARRADPIVFWATPENPASERVSACSLVGAHTFVSALRQMGRTFELVIGHPEDERTLHQLQQAVRRAYAVHALRGARLGLVGAHAPGFIDMHADPFLLQRTFGVQLHHFALQEFLDAVENAPPDEVDADFAGVRALGLPLQDLAAEDLLVSSKYAVAFRTLFREHMLDALAVREWPELSDTVGHWPYLAMARLAGEGVALACEGDADGALSVLLAECLGLGPVYLSDWLEHTRQEVVLWHGGNAPFALCNPPGTPNGPRIGRHFNNRNPAVVDAELRADMPVTVFRLWHCDGEYRFAGCEGVTVKPDRPLAGTNGRARIDVPDVEEWFMTACEAGLPHHVAVVEGHCLAHIEKTLRHFSVRRIGR